MQATGLGSRVEEAQISLELLGQLINALRFDPVDELYLANRYASLLETHLKAFRRRFFRVGRSRDSGHREQALVDNPNSNGEQRRQVDQVTFAYSHLPSNANIDPNLNQIQSDGNGSACLESF